jgi:hypothetical protein
MQGLRILALLMGIPTRQLATKTVLLVIVYLIQQEF